MNKTIILATEEEWKYFYAMRTIFAIDNDEYDWYPKNVGSFFTNWLLRIINYGGPSVKDKVTLSERFDEAFTISEMNISILTFAHLHTTNEFKQLLVSEDMAKLESWGWGSEKIDPKFFMANFPSSFYKCFQQEKSYFEQLTLE